MAINLEVFEIPTTKKPIFHLKLTSNNLHLVDIVKCPREIKHTEACTMISSHVGVFFKSLKSKYDDVAVDRLNYVYTNYILLGCATLLFTRAYVGEPLQCWVPKQWNGVWEQFSEQYCFIENTYFVPMNDTNMPSHEARNEKEMIYYQWVPFILVLMALFFYFPRAIWNMFSKYSDLAISDMMSAARTTAKNLQKNEKLQIVAEKITHRVNYQPALSNLRYESALFNLYIVTKTLIFINLFLQFFFLNHFLGSDYIFWGFGILSDLLQGRQWQESGHFPRVAFCDLTVREMGNVNKWTVQCVLMINMFNEKIFLAIWWWLLFVLICTTFDYIAWLLNRFSIKRRQSFLKALYDSNFNDRNHNELEDFYNLVLKNDGILVLKLLDRNGGRIQSANLFKALWENYEGRGSKPTTPISSKKHPDDESALLLSS